MGFKYVVKVNCTSLDYLFFSNLIFLPKSEKLNSHPKFSTIVNGPKMKVKLFQMKKITELKTN